MASRSKQLTQLTSFERAVLREVSKIPRGQVRTYSQIAKAIGQPKAARAVGNALAKNPCPIRIPCHRVVCADGSPGNYSGPGGRKGKLALLAQEGAKLRRPSPSKTA